MNLTFKRSKKNGKVEEWTLGTSDFGDLGCLIRNSLEKPDFTVLRNKSVWET